MCLSHTYVDSPDLVMNRDGLCLDKDLQWHRTRTPFFIELLCDEENPMLSAQQLCRAENEIYESAKLKDHAYSLFFGPCTPTSIKLAIVKGLWRKDVSQKFISLEKRQTDS